MRAGVAAPTGRRSRGLVWVDEWRSAVRAAELKDFEAATLDRRELALVLLDDLVCGVSWKLAFLVRLRCLTSDERVFDELPLGRVLCGLGRLRRASRRSPHSPRRRAVINRNSLFKPWS
jgi:hypothetical protein